LNNIFDVRVLLQGQPSGNNHVITLNNKNVGKSFHFEIDGMYRVGSAFP
jgi:hypothetical protein